MPTSSTNKIPVDRQLMQDLLVACVEYGWAETCGLTTPPSRPPARVIAFGCPSFDDSKKAVKL